MKLSIALISAAAVLASSFASASATTVRITGAFESYDATSNTISIVNAKSGSLETFKYSAAADIQTTEGYNIKLDRLPKGADIILRLEAAK
ncbi:hypothetical protein TDB9533_01743 [Thalassocella blandensis]|nr:hypothetical protein TDB9533_01743 [Thalassocella blandensis]